MQCDHVAHSLAQGKHFVAFCLLLLLSSLLLASRLPMLNEFSQRQLHTFYPRPTRQPRTIMLNVTKIQLKDDNEGRLTSGTVVYRFVSICPLLACLIGGNWSHCSKMWYWSGDSGGRGKPYQSRRQGNGIHATHHPHGLHLFRY